MVGVAEGAGAVVGVAEAAGAVVGVAEGAGISNPNASKASPV